MKLIFLFCLVAFAALAVRAYKKAAKRKFRRAVETYERARLERIADGENPISIPTVEEFLAARGQLHLLWETDRDVQFASSRAHLTPSDQSVPSWAIKTEMSTSFEDDFDNDYEVFVDEMWSHEGISLDGFILHRRTRNGDLECVLHSLVEGTQNRIYLNLYEENERKTYAADSRHEWFVYLPSGRTYEVDYSAFVGIKNGADPNVAFGEDVHPRTVDQAVLTEFDRIKTSDKKYVIGYRSEKGLSYRTISRVIRQRDRFSARCHFRWGERRTFLNERLISVLDLQKSQAIDADAFLRKQK